MSSIKEISENFHQKLSLKGYKGKIVHAKRIPDLRNDMKKLKEHIYPQIYKDYKTYFEFIPDVEFSEINSLFIIAVPVPQFQVKFYRNQQQYSTLIPPTYLYGKDITNNLKDLLSEILSPTGYNLAYARLPQKTLSVRCGLAEFGRNNITYISGLGSFYRLTTFYSDFPTNQDNWQEIRMMDLCKECSACVRKCPTGAIQTDRFLLHTERCLTHHNEQPGSTPFPDWIDPSWHNCLVGCLYCQKVCPANKKVNDWIDQGPEFTEIETKILLEGKKSDQLPHELKKKIEDFDLDSYLDLFPRNLNSLFYPTR
ncbi:MAG: 4Fe-4S double cluster binding domain-containing protein [Promethearchaeota archaeon]|jgi:epoxyqueuosine reductase